MKGIRTKVWSLVVSLMLPGVFTWSCSGTAARTIRDEAVQGAADAVEARAFELVAEILAPPADDGEGDD